MQKAIIFLLASVFFPTLLYAQRPRIQGDCRKAVTDSINTQNYKAAKELLDKCSMAPGGKKPLYQLIRKFAPELFDCAIYVQKLRENRKYQEALGELERCSMDPSTKKLLADQIDVLIWREDSGKFKTENLYHYLKTMPNGNYIKQAKNAIDQMVKDSSEWSTAEKGPSLKSYQDYLNNNPSGHKASEAKKRIKQFLDQKSAARLQAESIQQLVDNMIPIEGGKFSMGCNGENCDNDDQEEYQPHTVRVRGFKLGKYEVTVVQWRAILGSNPDTSEYYDCDSCPVVGIDFADVINSFLPKLKEKTGQVFRLPSEAEWEYAARGGDRDSNFLFSGSNDLIRVGWYDVESAQPVGKKSPNQLGLYDMSGNAYEMCMDEWHENYKGAPHNSRPWVTTSANERVVRGGAWKCEKKADCRVFDRDKLEEDQGSQYKSYGFSLAQDLP